MSFSLASFAGLGTRGRASVPERAREVFRLRREGQGDAAMRLAAGNMQEADRGAWDARAYGWCLIDRLKQCEGGADDPEAARLAADLRAIEVPADDDLLTRQRAWQLSRFDGNGREIAAAVQCSKAGDFAGAIRIYDALLRDGRLARERQAGFGWDLYKRIKELLASAGDGPLLPGAVDEARRALNLALRLDVERPSQCHSLLLVQALRLSDGGHLDIARFVRLWDLSTLRPEDYEGYRAADGKRLPSLAERVIQRAAKTAIETRNQEALAFLLPHVEGLVARFPDSPWPCFYQVKILRDLGRGGEAARLAIDFVRVKPRDYWAWELLGDLQEEAALRRACYARALSCSQADEFVGKVRIKLAGLLAESGWPGQARAEIERVIAYRQGAGYKPSAEIQRLVAAQWYAEAAPVAPDKAFYDELGAEAAQLLTRDLPRHVAVIDHVNAKIGKFHCVASRTVHGLVRFADYPRAPCVGDPVEIQVAPRERDGQAWTEIVSARPTREAPSVDACRSFDESVRISNGMGFGDGGVFIAPDLVARHAIADGDRVGGVCVISFNKKKQRWGWKAISIAIP